jgi:hypothetical protein
MTVDLPFGQSARSASILVVDDEPDIANMFRQPLGLVFGGERLDQSAIFAGVLPRQNRVSR